MSSLFFRHVEKERERVLGISVLKLGAVFPNVLNYIRRQLKRFVD